MFEKCLVFMMDQLLRQQREGRIVGRVVNYMMMVKLRLWVGDGGS